LPPEETRVKLQPIKGVPGSDYINANYISGELPGTERQYITTQGPLANTTCDFWRMVWEQGCKIIVMLTKETESGREKCYLYWPPIEGDTLRFDDITVKLEHSTSDTPQISIRDIKILKDGEERGIKHYQYTEWPDHGLPHGTQTFLHLLKLVNNFNRSLFDAQPPPVCIHCSAGIGRTGTYCTVNNILQYINYHVEKENKIPPINVLRTVLDLRDQRPGMVQTKEQYMFCYHAIEYEYQKIKQNIQNRNWRQKNDKHPALNLKITQPNNNSNVMDNRRTKNTNNKEKIHDSIESNDQMEEE